jgi:serine protease inhibitor
LCNQFFRLVLVNAIYFKGDWAKKFKTENTRKGTFHLADGSTVETDMMYMSSEFRAANLKDIDARALEMPYKGNRLSMIFILPQESLAKTEAALSGFDFSGLKFGPSTKFDVHVPKFKIESTHELNDPLKNLGLTDMFDEHKADFSGKNIAF